MDARIENMKITAESEKAVKIAVLMPNGKEGEMWFPKSQIKEGVVSDWIISQKARDFGNWCSGDVEGLETSPYKGWICFFG